VTFLNHGSFGACPRPVFDAYQRWQRELEREPVEFLARRLDELLEEARSVLAAYVGARVEDLVFVTNAMTGMNTLARSLISTGDEVLTSDQEYGAVDAAWEAAGATLVRAPLESLWDGMTERTRVVSLSHVTSPTGQIVPVKEHCRRARELGLMAVVDGAHGPGHVLLDLEELGALAYTGNCHKWLSAPKGAGFLWVAPELQDRVRPLVTTWGWDEQEFAARHSHSGTRDPASWLSVPAAIEFQREHEWDEVRSWCHALVEQFAEASGLPMVPSAFGQMASFELSHGDPAETQLRLWDEHRIEVPCFEWNGRPLIRLSVQGYNTEAEVERLAAAL